MLEDLSDKMLLEAADEYAGFRILYSRYWEGLYKKAFHRLGNSHDAQDAVQNIFISLWRNREKIQVDETLAPYLFTALRYYIIKQIYRKAKKGINTSLSVESLERAELSTEQFLQYRELQSIIDGEINELPERMKEIYRMSRVENLEIADIAVQLKISEQTVKNTLTTVLKRLRESLSHYSSLLIFLF